MSRHHHTPRSTTIRDKHRAAIARGKPPCALCNQPIDYSLPHLDPMSFQVDHIIPIARGGRYTLENSQPAHRACNRAKSDKIAAPPIAPLTTHRHW